MEELKLLAKITKKLKKLTLEWKEYKLELNIVDGEIDLIELDQWLTRVFLAEHEKVQLRNKLSGNNKKFILPK